MSPARKSQARVSGESGIHIVVCLGMFLFFVIFALKPASLKYMQVRQRVAALKCQVAEHAGLVAFYAEVTAALDSPSEPALKAVESVPLDTREFAGIHSQLQGVATECGLKLLKVTPHVSKLSGRRHFLGVNVVAEGGFVDMKTFLLNIFKMPGFFHLEHLSMVEGVDGEQIEVLVWMSVK